MKTLPRVARSVLGAVLLAAALLGHAAECLQSLPCIDFNDQVLHNFQGYLPCQFSSPGVTFSIGSPGPSGSPTDYYMHAKDESGASIIQNLTNFNGNWLCLVTNSCASLCYDFRLFIDGFDQGSLSITSAMVLLSDSDGPCGPNPPIRAVWRASYAVTENGGTNEGWHTFCAPLDALRNGNLPSNSLGNWQMLDGRPNSDWPVLLSNVTGIQFPIDFTSNPAEEVGYDNICLVTNVCPPRCLVLSNEVVNCLSNGLYTYTFSVTNYFDGPVSWIGFMNLTNGVTVDGESGSHLVFIDPPLQKGQGTNITVTINSTSAAPSSVCFTITAHNFALYQCCAIEHCIELPRCCAIISQECVNAPSNGGTQYTYSFTYQNLAGVPVKYIFVTPDTNYTACFSPAVITLPTALPNGAVTNLSVTLNISSNCGPTICVYISAHQANFAECCAERRCFSLPNCCKPRTYTLDADFDSGTLVNLNHSPSDQLQLNPIAKPFPYVNVACSARGTAVRIDVNTGQVLGEYYTSPNGMGRLPSRTTVDKFGNVWVANRNEYSASPSTSSNFKGSVVRIGLIIGGTRGKKDSFGNFVPDPTGAYLAPPYIYNTCVDRDGDGLIKTSKGLADILPWNNPGNVDSDGGVSSAEDEAITVYTRVNGTGTRFIGIDCNNNVWTGGDGDQDFQMLDGFTGAPVPGFAFNLGGGGYGGLIDGAGNLWGAHQLMRFTPSTSLPPGTGLLLPYWVYGLGINPLNCHVFASSAWNAGWTTNYGVAEFDAVGNVVNAYPAVGSGGGMCVDGNGHVWVSQGGQVAHLAPSGPSHVLVGYINMDNASQPFGFVWGAAVDVNGKIWVTDANRDVAMRIDPTLAAGLGAVDLVVPLGQGAYPYNYSDMTGFVELSSTCRSGFWDVIHDGCTKGNPWGKVSWNSLEPAGTSITVEVRASDSQGTLPSVPWTTVKNGASFCDGKIRGQYLEVRVSFTAPGCTQESPVLYDLTVECCQRTSSCAPTNHAPEVRCPGPIDVCAGAGTPASATVSIGVFDADGDPLTVSWSEGGNPPFRVDNVPAGGPPTSAVVGFTTNFTPGIHVITVVVSDSHGTKAICDITVRVGDIVAPKLECPPGVKFVGFKGQIPEFAPLTLSDNCTPSNQIKVVQTPAAGTPVPAGSYTVTLIATDLAGNSATCQTFYAVSPNVKVTAPAKYSTFTAPVDVPIAATVDPQAGAVSEVWFYDGNRLLGTTRNLPYGLTAHFDSAGFFGIRAVAIAPDGSVASSDPVQVIVGGTMGEPAAPTIAIPIQMQDQVKFVVPTSASKTYDLECTTSLTPPIQWRVIHTVVGDGNTVILNDVITNRPCQFYRLIVR